jgi:tRNA (guanine-N7-)-methyltransferase
MNPAPTRAPGAPTLIYRPLSYVERLDLLQLFPQPQPLEVELGSGDGSFLAQYAQLHPDRNFIGVERLLGRLRKLDRKGLRAGLKNLRLMRIEASYLLEYLLPPGSVQALHIYFPDPWPKRRHRKHRLINDLFTAMSARALVPEGTVYLRTDDADYFTQMTRVFSLNPDFNPAETPARLEENITDFERHFRDQGLEIYRAAFQRKI